MSESNSLYIVPSVPCWKWEKKGWVVWSIIRQPKDQSGLDVQNIELQNQCLLSKWLFKLLNKDGLWKTILRKKYLANQTLGKAQKRPGVSHFWAGLMDAKQSFFRYGSFQLNNEKQTRF